MRFSSMSLKLSFVLSSIFLIAPSRGSASDEREYPISSDVRTTVERTVVPDPLPAGVPTILPNELWKYKRYGYGAWHYGPGLPFVKRFDIMSPTYTGLSVNHAGELLYFFAISDVHMRDKESPAQAIYLGVSGLAPTPSAYSGTMLYTTQTLDAAIRTINRLHKKKPFDFGIVPGDACNCAQYNELRWFIDVMDGKTITPSSGSHVGSHSIDYQKPFKAAGLNKRIRWYMALGNHDHFWFGLLTPNRYIRHRLIGREIINLGNFATNPLGANSRGYYMGSVNGKTRYGLVFGAGPQQNFTHPPRVETADSKRHAITKKEFVKEFFNTTSHPKGHGFKNKSKETGFACYAFEPKSKMPIKIIVLDDTENSNTPSNPLSLGHGHGYLDTQRYNWLVRELDKGQAHDKLMIIVAHVPIGLDNQGSQEGWLDPTFETNLIAKLHSYPNLLMWIAGHDHINTITALPSTDPSHPEQGFWSVEVSSLLSFPQQFRTFRIVRNSDNTISLLVANVDPAVKRNSMAAKSRTYAIGAKELYHSAMPYPPTGSYNGELFKQLTPQMATKIQNLFKE